MNSSATTTLLRRVGAGLTAAAAIAAVPATWSPATAAEDRPACSKQEPAGGSGKKCPTPSPSVEPTQGPAPDESGCRDVISGQGLYLQTLDNPLASALEFQVTLAAPSCSDVTYAVIARDAETLAELARSVQTGNGTSADIVVALPLPGYVKDCIAVDVVVSEGSLVHDVAPNTRSTSEVSCDLHRDGAGPQTWN